MSKPPVTAGPRCVQCAEGNHSLCLGWVMTGRMVPDTDPYRERTQLVREWLHCDCDCHPDPDAVEF